MKRVLSFITLLLALVSCAKDEVDYKVRDEQIISDYIAANNLNAVATGSGLYYVMEKTGDYNRPTINSMVHVKYKGYLTDGTVFDQTTGTNYASFYLYEVIQGWQEGMQLFGKGGKGKLLIPSYLAYGEKSTADIPAHSVLIFDIELLDIYNK